MSGKASLIVILGFSMLFMVISGKFSGVSGRMTDNYVEYYNETISHNIAVSGANLAASQIFLNNKWSAGFNDLDYQGGSLFVEVKIAGVSITGDTSKQIVSTGIFNDDTSIVSVKLSPSKFSKFAYYSVSEGGTIWWMAKDTVDGPFHTQDYLRASKHPTFYGKASTKKGIIYQTNKNTDKPYFYGGYETGVDLPMPTDAVEEMKIPAVADGWPISGKDTVYLDFRKDTLYFKYKYNDPYSKAYLPDQVPNGVIYAENSVIRLKGTVKGRYSVVAGSSTTSKGTVYLDDDIVYDKDPRVYPNSTDMLGIVAKNNVIISDNPTYNNNIKIHASIYAQNGGFKAENHDTRDPSGFINLLGGIIQKTRGAVGMFDGVKVTQGFAKYYKYDERFKIVSPPFYPGTGGFEIVSWYE